MKPGAIASEIIRHNLFDRVHIGLDFFDASINRIAASGDWHPQYEKALLRALLEPTAQLRQLENDGDYTARPGAARRAKIAAVAGHLGDVLSASRHAGGQPVAGQRTGL